MIHNSKFETLVKNSIKIRRQLNKDYFLGQTQLSVRGD